MLESGLFLFVMVAALPIVLAVLMALHRRHPQGAIARHGGAIRAVLAVVYVAAAVEAYARSDKARGGLFMASGLALAALAAFEQWLRRGKEPTGK